MDEDYKAVAYRFNDQTTSDVTVSISSGDGGQELFHCHWSVLTKHCKFFADQLSTDHPCEPIKCIKVFCKGSEYDHYIKLLKLLYTRESISYSWDSLKTVLGVLRASIALQCEPITKSCIQYIEAVPWEQRHDEDILKIVPALGSASMPILSRIKPVDLSATKKVFISALRFATTIDRSFPPFGDELKTSAQEQVEYMLVEDDDTPLVLADEDVRSEMKAGLAKMFATFETELSLLPSDFDQSSDVAEQRVLQSLSDLDWISNLLPKLEMMKEFVSSWNGLSDHLLAVVQDEKFSSGLWGVKSKLIEMTGKALDAVGYGNVVLAAPARVQFLKTWLPYMRSMKLALDSKFRHDDLFLYKMDNDMCENIEGAIVSLVLTLPSNDQADILGDWMKRSEQMKFPDLSEAFEVWCYRTKAAKRRLAVGISGVGNPTVGL